MDAQELATRQALEIMHETIQSLCLRRDQLAATLPRPKKAAPVQSICGMEIKAGGGKRRKKAPGSIKEAL